MYCTNCGDEITRTAKYCPACGTKIQSPIVSEKSTPPPLKTAVQTGNPVEKPQIMLGQKWLRFWNYFSLPVGGILGVLMSLVAPALLLIAILHFVVAYGLYQRRMWAWQWNWVLIGMTYLSMLIPNSTHGVPHSNIDLGVQFVMRLIFGSLIWMWPNYVYWRKRRVLFEVT